MNDREQFAAMSQRIKKLEHEKCLIMNMIKAYGGIDGVWHKQWLLDQIIRELTGNRYAEWVKEFQAGEDGPETYSWDTGIAP